MANLFRKIIRLVPTFLFSLLLALIVWGFAVTSADPVEERAFPRPVKIEIIGQDPRMILTEELPGEVNLTLSAPKSVLDKLESNPASVRAVVDLSSLAAGSHTLPVQVQINTRPVKVVAQSPESILVSLEVLASRSLPVQLITIGQVAVGFEAGQLTLSQESVTISGPQSIVEKAGGVQAVLDITQAREDINRSLTLQVVDTAGNILEGLTIMPEKITVSQPITQLGGYRTVVVKVLVTGQVASGYRLTNISAYPAVVTVFSANPTLVDQLPGYVETYPFSLTGLKDDVDVRLDLILPSGVSVVGDPSVQVQVGIATIEGSLTMTSQPVEFLNLDPSMTAEVSPQTVDVILSGPLPILDRLTTADLRVVVDLNGLTAGIYQLHPTVELQVSEIRVESILPESVEVRIQKAPLPTPTPKR